MSGEMLRLGSGWRDCFELGGWMEIGLVWR